MGALLCYQCSYPGYLQDPSLRAQFAFAIASCAETRAYLLGLDSYTPSQLTALHSVLHRFAYLFTLEAQAKCALFAYDSERQAQGCRLALRGAEMLRATLETLRDALGPAKTPLHQLGKTARSAYAESRRVELDWVLVAAARGGRRRRCRAVIITDDEGESELCSTTTASLAQLS
jgi:hypothetical protein